jgi:hypothetical protein
MAEARPLNRRQAVPEPTSVPDPFAIWREWVAQSERQWNTFLNQAMATEQYGQSLGKFMELSLAMQKAMSDTMGRYLSALNVPTRADVLALGERLSAIEERLVSIEARLGRPSADGPDGGAVAAPRPPRTKKPAGWSGEAAS